MSKPNMGSSIDDFLKQEGIFEGAQADSAKDRSILLRSSRGWIERTSSRCSMIPNASRTTSLAEL